MGGIPKNQHLRDDDRIEKVFTQKPYIIFYNLFCDFHRTSHPLQECRGKRLLYGRRAAWAKDAMPALTND
jgi:hypothetical protein